MQEADAEGRSYLGRRFWTRSSDTEAASKRTQCMQGRVAQAQLTSSLLTGLANPVCLHRRAKNKRGHWRYMLTVSSKSAQSAIRRCTRVPNMWCALFPFSLHSVRFGECIEASACLHHVMLSLALGSHMNLCLCFFQAGNVAWARMLRHPNRRPGFVLSVGLSRAGAVGHVPRLTRQVAGQHSSRSGRLPSNLELAGLSRIASCSARLQALLFTGLGAAPSATGAAGEKRHEVCLRSQISRVGPSRLGPSKSGAAELTFQFLASGRSGAPRSQSRPESPLWQSCTSRVGHGTSRLGPYGWPVC